MSAVTAVDTVDFVDSVRGDVARWDLDGALPIEVIRAAGRHGLLAADLPPRHGGLGATPEEVGTAAARLGGVCSALRGLLTVQGMVAAALARWGSDVQRRHWLPALSSGERIAGFAATESAAGSDLAAVETSVEMSAGAADGDLAVDGDKLWVTFGAVADVLLVLGSTGGRPVAVLVETDRPGVDVRPVRHQLGMRAAHLAHVRLDGVRVPRANLVAPAGFGRSHVAATALDHGRFTVAWGCAGMAEAALRYAAAHAARRKLSSHQTVRAMLGRALARSTAATEVCRRAARLRRESSPDAVPETILAKYTAARAAAAVTRDAVQVCGAAGCAPGSPVERMYRDAKVMQIIEGSDEVNEVHLGTHALRRTGAS